MPTQPARVARMLAIRHEMGVRTDGQVESPFLGVEVDKPHEVTRVATPEIPQPQEPPYETRIRRLGSVVREIL